MAKETLFSRRIAIGSKIVGAGHPCLIVGEIGSNHNRDLATAKRLIDACQHACVDAVKFQFYTPEDIIPSHLPAMAYGWEGYSEKYAVDVFRHHLATPAEWFPELAHYTAARGLIAFAAVHDVQWAEFAVRLGFPILKLASMEITNLELIRAVAEIGKPLIISTGMGHLPDIDRAVRAARQAGSRDLILLHCVANYPAELHELNLRQIATLQQCFDTMVGFSDHSLGSLAAVIAVTQGVCLIEKHVTLKRQQFGPDHHFALEQHELGELVRNIRASEAALGTGSVTAIRADEAKRSLYLRSVVGAHALPAGHKIELTDLTLKRPGTGISPRYRAAIVGRELQRDIAADKPIQWDDLK